MKWTWSEETEEWEDIDEHPGATIGSANALSEEPEEPLLYGADGEPIRRRTPIGFRRDD